MRDHNLELTPEQSEALISAMQATDARNAAMGVTGSEVAAYNVRVLRLEHVRRWLEGKFVVRMREERKPTWERLAQLEREHADHPVTKKIQAYREAANDDSKP